MPTLKVEPDQWPLDLWTIPRTDERRWWVAHTLPRQEKALARELLAVDLPYYLPCERRRAKVRGRITLSRIPLFGGYLFLRANRDERIHAFATKRVARLIEVIDQDRLERDLAKVRRIVDLGLPITVEHRLDPGTKVTVRSGPLMGTTGTVLRTLSGFKFVVGVEFLQRGVSVLVDGHQLGL